MGRPVGAAKKRKARADKPAERDSKRRRGKASNDVYEAEDSDPDEVKHAYRYDQVDNYQYEPPSEIEDDEEIDEELAFTAEDKKKYGGWFDDDGPPGGSSDDADEDEDQRDSDLDILYSDEELQESKRSKRGQEQSDEDEWDEDEEVDEGQDAADAEEDDEDDELLRQLGSDEEGEGEDEDDLDEDRHREMLAAVVGSADAKKRSGPLKQVVVSEVYPEAEFALNPGAASAGGGGELTLADLMAGLGGEGRKKLPSALRKELDKMTKGTKSQVVSAPLPRVIKERAERTAGYQLTKDEVSKWQPIVKANREAPTLQFTTARDEVPRISTTAAIVAQHSAETEMEAEVAALLQAAGAASAAAVAKSEEALAAKALTVEEAKERRGRLAKLRALLFYHELKAKRLKQIKSKEYHKKAAKADKRRHERALLAGAEAEDDEDEGLTAARAELETQEFERAKERLTLKHRNTSRWARRALKRGATITDAGTKAAVAEQLRLGQALKRRIEGRLDDSDEDDDDGGSGSESGSEGEDGADAVGSGVNGRGMSTRVKALALDILSGPGPQPGEDLPKKGLFALPFMARALERKRQTAVLEAQQALDEADGNGAHAGEAAHAPGQAAGRRRFGGAQQTAGADHEGVDSEQAGLDSDEEEDREAKQQRLTQASGKAEQASKGNSKSSGKGRQGLRIPTAEEEADLDRALGLAGPGASASASPARQQQQGAGGGVATATAAANGSHAAGAAGFIPAKKFQGAKPGMVFTKGPKGLGYYEDVKANQKAGQAANGKQKGAGKQQAAVAGVAKLALAAQQQQATQAATPGTSKPAAAAGGKRAAANGQQHEAGEDSSSDDEGPGAAKEGFVSKVAAAASKAAEQRTLVSMAFAADDVEAEFAAEKAAEVVAELPHIEEPSSLPGWGAWSDQQKDPKWMRDARAKAQREREKAAASRSDAKLQHVILSEKYDRKAMTRYTTPQVPFPFDSKDTYERSIRQPLGRQYNPDASFRDLTRPAVLKNTGVVIEPIRFSKPVAKYAHDESQRADKPKVLTVAGGMVQKAKKAKNKK